MTKNRSMKIAVLVLALALLTSCFVGSTFAKYSSTGTGTASVNVAKWAVTVNGDDLTAVDPVVNFNLVETYVNYEDGAQETGVNGKLLAPGTKGSFSFTIANNSDVWAEYGIEVVVKSGNLPAGVVFSTTETGSYGALSTLDIGGNLEYGDSETVTVYWQWDFDGDDTADGIAAATAPEVVFEATVTVEQLDQAPAGV